MTQNNDFRFYLPIEDLQKGKNKEGDEVYKFRGLASTDSEDADGEFLDPNGFELDQFKFVNYNHLREPKYIIGEPTKAKIVPGKGLMVEGDIWGDTEMGKQVIDLMKVMEKSSSNKNRLGISVEGKALQRDPINNKRVTKAKITAIALCPIPKNADTWAELIKKGFVNDDEEPDYNIEKSESPNGGDQYIIDVTDPSTGMRYMVKKDFSIKVEKAMSIGNAGMVTKEDLEGKEKNLNDQNIRKSIMILAAANKLGQIKDDVLQKAKKIIKNIM